MFCELWTQIPEAHTNLSDSQNYSVNIGKVHYKTSDINTHIYIPHNHLHACKYAHRHACTHKHARDTRLATVPIAVWLDTQVALNCFSSYHFQSPSTTQILAK